MPAQCRWLHIGSVEMELGRPTGHLAGMRALSWLFLAFAAACATVPPRAATTERTAAVVQAALDGEALYTLAGGLKPMSQGIWQGQVVLDAPDLGEVRAVRAALAPWRNDELWADVAVFSTPYAGKRAAIAYVMHRQAVADVVAQHQAFFAPYGIAVDTHPAEVAAVVERMPELDRHRGLGLLFGYPLPAIEFFVTASASAKATGEQVPRRFVQIPTFAHATGRFVYAVPADAPESAADRELAARAAVVLARCRELRAATPATDADTLLTIAATLSREFAANTAGAR